MGFSLKLLVHLSVIGCFIGNTLTYPIDDKEEISKFQLNRPVGQPSSLKVSAVPSGESSHGAINDKSFTDVVVSQQKTKGEVVGAGDLESTLSLTAVSGGQPLNQNIDEVNEPVPSLDGPVEVKNHDITKAKRSAEDDEGVYTSYSFQQSRHNGKITEQVYEKEANKQDYSKDSDSEVDSDSDDSDSLLNSGSDSHSESDADSDANSDSDSDNSDSKNSEKIKYKVRRSSDSQLGGTNGAGNTKDKVEKNVEEKGPAVTTDHPDNDDLDSKDINKNGRSSDDKGNLYYEGESLNFYSNSDDTQRASFLNPSYDEGDETYSEGESGVEGTVDGAFEYTDDAYRRAKRSNDVDSKLLSIIKNLKEESAKVEENKDLNETPDSEGSLLTDEQPSGETVLKNPAYTEDGYGIQLDNKENVKNTESEDSTDAPTEENKHDAELDDTFPITSAKDSVRQDSSQIDPPSAVAPQRFNYRRVKRNNVYVLIAKKKSEKSEETAEVTTEAVNIPDDKLNSETSNFGESQSKEKLEYEEPYQVTKVKRSSDLKPKLVEIKNKIENEQLNKATNENDDKPPSEIQQEVISAAVDEPLTIGQSISTSSSTVEDPSSVTYSNEYGRVSRNDDVPSSFEGDYGDSGSDVQSEQHPFEENYDENGPIVRNDDPQEEDAQPMSWINQ